MSINHRPAPRQDRRGVGRAPTKIHQEHTVGTVKPTILDDDNGNPFGDDGAGGAPGQSGPATTGYDDD